MSESITLLPADDLIAAGIRALQDRQESIASLLVKIRAPKLRSLGGVHVPDIPPAFAVYPEHRLYDLLSADDSDSAHSRYNALIRKLVSFERALPCVRK